MQDPVSKSMFQIEEDVDDNDEEKFYSVQREAQKSQHNEPKNIEKQEMAQKTPLVSREPKVNAALQEA